MWTHTATSFIFIVTIYWPNGVRMDSDIESKCKSCKEMTENFKKVCLRLEF